MQTNGQGRPERAQRARAGQQLEMVPRQVPMEFDRLKTGPRENVERSSVGEWSELMMAQASFKQISAFERETPKTLASMQRLASFSWFAPKKREPVGLVQGFKKICERWGLDLWRMATLLHLENEVGLCADILSGQLPPMTGDLKDRMAIVIGISIGLGDLFDDDEGAELDWLGQPHRELEGISPLQHLLKGDYRSLWVVSELVEQARGLR